MANIEMGTLYDINKSLVKKNEVTLSDDILKNKKELIINFLNDKNNYFFMLLCNEKRDYTVFHDANLCSQNTKEKIANILIDECLKNRGEIRGIELTKEKDAIEIWMVIDDDAYVYYFFPYDKAIIEVE